MKLLRCVAWLVVLVVCAGGGGCGLSPLDRVSVIGASVSAGVGASVEEGNQRKPVDLADALAAAGAVKGESGPRVGKVTSHADAMYFMNPGGIGDKELDAALLDWPGCVVALDDLFWHVYGNAKSDAVRLERLDKRLAGLAAVKAPLVIGDVPDMSSAHPGMLSKEQVAPEAVRVEANARIHAWAAGRANVAVVPLSDVVAGAKAGRVKIGDRELVGEEATRLIGPDRLHASAEGLAVLAILILDAEEEIRTRIEKSERKALPRLEDVIGRLRPRPQEERGLLGLMNLAMELKQVDDESQKVGIELDQALELAKAGRAQRVAEVLPNLWVREIRCRSFFSTGQWVREDVYRACEKAGVDVKARMAPVRDSFVETWRTTGHSGLAAEIVVLDELMGEPRRNLEILKAGALMESSAVEGRTPALDMAWRLLGQSEEKDLGAWAAAFANPLGAQRREAESYASFVKNAGMKGSIISESDAADRKRRSMQRSEQLATALDQAGRSAEAGEVRLAAERVYGEKPTTAGPVEMWVAEKKMEPGAYRAAYLRALRKHLGMETGPGVELAPAWDDVYANAAGRIQDRGARAESLRLVKEWRAGLTDGDTKRRGIAFQLAMEDALGMEPEVIDDLVEMRKDSEGKAKTEFLAHRAMAVAAKGQGAARACVLFDDYRAWPARVMKSLEQVDKDTGGARWMSNESIRYSKVKELVRQLRAAAVCLRAAARTEEAEILEKKEREIAWKEPGWAR